METNPQAEIEQILRRNRRAFHAFIVSVLVICLLILLAVLFGANL